MNDQPEQLTPVGATTFAAIMDGIADKQAADLHHTSVEDNANRAEACANGDCVHARNGARAARIAGEYRYGVEEALDYLSDDRDGITPEVAETLRGILQRAIESPSPTV